MKASEAVDMLETNIRRIKVDYDTQCALVQIFTAVRKQIEETEKKKDAPTD